MLQISLTISRYLPRSLLLALSLLLLLNPSPISAGPPPSIEIVNVYAIDTRLRQGDLLPLILHIRAEKAAKNLTAEFSVIDNSGREVAVLGSDFFSIDEPGASIHRFEFRWSDLEAWRSGNLHIRHTFLKQHDLANRQATTIAKNLRQIELHVTAVTDPVEKLFVSRENSLWWLMEMGRVDTLLAREHGLQNCVMFGGSTDSWIRNDYLSSAGSDGLCYWEITGYAIRMLALEYEHSRRKMHLDLAMQIADAVVRNLRTNDEEGFPAGSLPTFNHYDGRVGEWFRDKAMMFDHGQILMGLLELARVMKKGSLPSNLRQPYEETARKIGDFMLMGSRQRANRVPAFWPVNSATASDAIEQTSKAVIGFNLLYGLNGNETLLEIAKSHLEEMLHSSPASNRDHHGRSYMAYGFIRAFLDYGKPEYLEAAKEWTESVAKEMDDRGRLLPPEEYSVLPAQSQLVRNGALLWELTADPEFIDWAGRSAQFLSDSPEGWTYRQPVLKLGRYFRQSGGLYNNTPTDELCSWASLFHIDAMYHYLRLRYGHIHVGPESLISMSGPVRLERYDDRIEIQLQGLQEENIGIHIPADREISYVEVDRAPFAYYSGKTARLPPFEGTKKVVVHFGESDLPRLETTNSHVISAFVTKEKGLHLKIRGQAGTRGQMQLFWPAEILNITLNDRFVADDTWQLDADGQRLLISIDHDGKEQEIKITPRR